MPHLPDWKLVWNYNYSEYEIVRVSQQGAFKEKFSIKSLKNSVTQEMEIKQPIKGIFLNVFHVGHESGL